MKTNTIWFYLLSWTFLALLAMLLLVAPCVHRERSASTTEGFEDIPVIIKEERGFLTAEECHYLIDLANKKGFEESRVVAEGKASGVLDHTVRRSEQVWVRPEDDVRVEELYRRLAVMTGVPTSHMEDLQILRYRSPPGGFYKPHYDDCRDDEKCTEFWADGGRRWYTVAIYLNGVGSGIERGGETDFPMLQRRITPETGKMVWWRNLTPDKKHTEPDSLHAGLPLEGNSVKYLANIWIRANPRLSRASF